MNVDIHQSWKPYLKPEFEKPYFKDLTDFVKSEYSTYQCFPKGSQIFNAFNHCTFNDVKVVIIGQDPYHGVGQANGLCFSVNDDIKHPPSLINIFKEIEQDLGVSYPKNGNLMPWADQGVLLLNATLTVRVHQAASHQNKGWELFTDAVIKTISKEKSNIVFLLWGGFAKKKKKLIDTSKHFVLETGHPSPLSANRGYWFGNKHFSKTNSLLEQVDLSAIEWKL
ncbi:uracil-DNA glycosylase [Winogradskyella sp. R77965]|uniref:uracil-DNA glycosylase n=1 Tax=Winogradskyella sp. R77965 TaxID=3093872 RepID=UPI0037DDBBAC